INAIRSRHLYLPLNEGARSRATPVAQRSGAAGFFERQGGAAETGSGSARRGRDAKGDAIFRSDRVPLAPLCAAGGGGGCGPALADNRTKSHSIDMLKCEFPVEPRFKERQEGRQQFRPPGVRLATVNFERPRICREALHGTQVNDRRLASALDKLN